MLNKLNYVVLLYCCIEVVISERNKFNKLLFVFLDKKQAIYYVACFCLSNLSITLDYVFICS